MKNKKIKCDIYTRVSTTMQVDGYSLDAQKEKLKRYAEFQNMEIVNEYSDEGKSGKSVEVRLSLHCIGPRCDLACISFSVVPAFFLPCRLLIIRVLWLSDLLPK